MSPRATRTLLLVQALALVLLGWAAAYLGRDEFHLLADRDEDEVPTAQRAEEVDGGLPRLHLGAVAQAQVGLRLAPTEPGRWAASDEWSATVLDAAPLVEGHGRLQAARHAQAAARAVALASATQARRARALYEDDRNGSQRALEMAVAQAAADEAQAQAAADARTALRQAALAQWGSAVGAWLDGADSAALQRLARGTDVLLRAAPRAGHGAPATALLQLARPGGGETVVARALGPMPAVDAVTGGPTWLFLAPGRGLAPGLRLAGRVPAAGPGVAGAWMPEGAVLWHAGQAWAYAPGAAALPSETLASVPQPAASGPVVFQRRALVGAQRVDGRWFVPGFEAGTPVVVQGAQLLLSEELKFQIRNENDD